MVNHERGNGGDTARGPAWQSDKCSCGNAGVNFWQQSSNFRRVGYGQVEGGGEDGEGGDKKREKRRRRRRRRRSKRQLPLCSSFGLMTLHFGWRFELGPFVLLLCYFCVTFVLLLC